MRHLVAGQTEDFRSSLMFVPRAERAGRDRMSNRGIVEGTGIGRMMLAATQCECEAFAAQVDDIGNHAGDRVFNPKQLVAANFVFQRHLYDFAHAGSSLTTAASGKKERAACEPPSNVKMRFPARLKTRTTRRSREP